MKQPINTLLKPNCWNDVRILLFVSSYQKRLFISHRGNSWEKRTTCLSGLLLGPSCLAFSRTYFDKLKGKSVLPRWHMLKKKKKGSTQVTAKRKENQWTKFSEYPILFLTRKRVWEQNDATYRKILTKIYETNLQMFLTIGQFNPDRD